MQRCIRQIWLIAMCAAIAATFSGCSGGGSGSGSNSLHTGSLMFIRAQLQMYFGAEWHDFDNDGDLDLLENPANQDLYLSRGRATEIVGERVLVAEGGSPSVADFNLDGLLDVAYIARIGARGTVTRDVAVILQRADGEFEPPALLGVGLDGAIFLRIETGDVNGDGAPDIVLSTAVPDVTSVFLGNGDGTFGPPIDTMFSEVDGLLVSSVLDMNGDGLDDGRFENPFLGQSAVFYTALSNGDGTFSVPIQIPLNRFSTVPADFNGDGFPDFISAAFDELVVHLGDSAVSYATSVVTPVLPPRAVDLVSLSGDFTGDGDVDVVVEGGELTTRGSGTYATYLFPGHGDGSFGGPIVIAEYTLEEIAAATAAADVDRDTRLDLIITGLAQHFLILFGNGDGTFRVETPPTIPAFPALELITSDGSSALDLDGDSRLDLLGFGVGVGNALIQYGRGDGTFETGQPTSQIPYTNPSDLDCDGDQDFWAYESASGLLRIWRTYARDDVRMLPEIPTGLVNIGAPIFKDMDGDSNVDIYIGADGVDGILYGLGDLQFEPVRLLGAASGMDAPELHDVNGDGRLDLVEFDGTTGFNDIGTESFVVRLGTGVRTYGPVVSTPTLLRPWFSPIRFADLNGDGRIDAISTKLDGAGFPVELRTYHANADAVFEPASVLPMPGPSTTAHAFDVDQDEDVDIVAETLDPGGVLVLTNDGSGNFSITQQFPVYFSGSVNASNGWFRDMTGEGIPDIAFLDIFAGLSVALGQGDGTFSGPYLFDVPSHPRVAFGDYDEDGDTDIVAVSTTRTTPNYLENRYVE